jgi:uncharacterized integral membrane protein
MQNFKNLIIFGLLALCALFLSINSQLVEFRLLPDILNFKNFVIHVPLFIILLISLGVGLLLGIIFEYIRARKDRKVAKKNLLQVERLNLESKSLRSKFQSETDEILSLLK